MLPTPNISNVDFSNIYEPAEDSFLLLDALAQDSEVKYLSERFSELGCPLVVEVGSGSGVILAFVANNAAAIFGNSSILTLSTDLNVFACRATAQTVQQNTALKARKSNPSGKSDINAVFLNAINASLTSPIRKHTVDLLIFNPPYVPSEKVPNTYIRNNDGTLQDLSRSAKFERDSQLLALATDGGENGMEVTDELLAQLSEVLNPHTGVAYILLCAQNRPELVKDRIRSWGSCWKVDTVRKSGKQGGWEKLEIIRIERRLG